jgi:tetraacyldisaccharide 4'-kinase
MSSQLSFWASRNFVAYCLTPLSLLYRLIIGLRRFSYRHGLKKITRFKVPVIVVGNITTGGTGKTPLVIWLVDFLKQQGFKPGIVSRGYGGRSLCYPQIVYPNSDPKEVGDEAVLLTRRTQCPMVIDPKRVNAVKKLLQDTNCNIVISDDGLQHYALERDIEIAVIDGERRFDNGFCLPAGPLREPIKRLKEVDFIVSNGKAETSEYQMRLVSEDFLLEKFKNKVVHAVAGIGNPQRFFKTLHGLGLMIIEHTFPDHYLFKANDFGFLKENEFVIMTEKDWVKCEAFVDERFLCLPVRAELDKKFGEQLLNKLKQLTI